MTVTVEIPMALKNPLNAREHWGAKAKRAKAQREAIRWTLLSGRAAFKLPPLRYPLIVTMTRVYVGRSGAMDDDGLSAAFKHVRDAVAAYLGVDDSNPCVTWRCAQERGPKASKAAVRIAIEVRAIEGGGAS